ncbi:MAG: helix-turn-helix domain-containing protein [Campylobacteraceae bacterium]|nr:helix-turn-helix domain-containing protein [Campylobacteraceae bacterium]
MTYVIKTLEEINQVGSIQSNYKRIKQSELKNLTNNKIYKLNTTWIFDENNAVVISPNKRFYLTQKELLFLKMLIKSERITTYKEMLAILWQGKDDVSLNAVRSFTKDIKKKLPPKILRNFQDVGYKLDL